MIKTMRYSVLVLLAVLLLVTACSPDNQQEPTQQDTSLIYTAAAQTVESQLTSAALQNPPTNTPEPAPTETQPAPPHSCACSRTTRSGSAHNSSSWSSRFHRDPFFAADGYSHKSAASQ